MPDQDYSNMGDKIQSFVEDAVNSMDFDMLNRNMRSSIQSVFDELNIKTSNSTGSGMEQRQNNGRCRSNVRYHYDSDKRQTERRSEQSTSIVAKPLYVRNPPGAVSGTICTAIGGVFTGIFGFVTVMMLLLDQVIPGLGFATRVTLASIVPLLAVSAAVLWKGTSLRKRVKRFRSYVGVLGKRTYCQVKELAAAVGKSEQFVVKDLQKMIENKSFPHGHIDMHKTCLMLDDETYQQYLKTQTAYRQRMLEEQKVQKDNEQVFSSDGINDPELIKAIEEGNRYIEQIRRANDAIPGVEISNKLFRLESLIRKIFDVLKKKPDQLPKLRKFMNYYMPTTLKLVQTYQELDAQPVEGENIRKSKADIEKTLDTINLAYEKLLDSFFEDAAMDISTDISVLETMFAQEGLTKNHFDIEN